MEIITAILLPFYVLFALLFAWVVGELYYKHNKIKRFLLPALSLKLFGAMTFACIYTFYYGVGDTFLYFKSALKVSEQICYEPSIAWKILQSDAQNYTVPTREILDQISYFENNSTWLVVKIVAILSLFGLKNYMLTTVIYSFLCFWGQWAMFSAFTNIFPPFKQQQRCLFVACFCVPSVVFWCGGIMKDTLMLACVGALFYCFYQLFIQHKKILFCFPIFILSLYTIIIVKFYIALALLPALFMWWCWHFFSTFKNPYLKKLTLLSLAVFLALSVYFFSNSYENIGDKIADKLIEQAFSMQSWHSYLDKTYGGSGYDLGKVDLSIGGLMLKFPASVNVTFFRPYLWEISSIVVLIAALESIFVSVITFWAILKTGILRSIGLLFTQPILLGCLLFCLAFGFLVGFTSYNFGALVRYKTPCLPFFFALILMLYYSKFAYPKTKSHQLTPTASTIENK